MSETLLKSMNGLLQITNLSLLSIPRMSLRVLHWRCVRQDSHWRMRSWRPSSRFINQCSRTGQEDPNGHKQGNLREGHIEGWPLLSRCTPRLQAALWTSPRSHPDHSSSRSKKALRVLSLRVGLQEPRHLDHTSTVSWCRWRWAIGSRRN